MTAGRSPEADAALVQAIATREPQPTVSSDDSGGHYCDAGVWLSVEERDRICALLTARTAVIDAVARVIYEFQDDEIFVAGELVRVITEAVPEIDAAYLRICDEARVPAEGE